VAPTLHSCTWTMPVRVDVPRDRCRQEDVQAVRSSMVKRVNASVLPLRLLRVQEMHSSIRSRANVNAPPGLRARMTVWRSTKC